MTSNPTDVAYLFGIMPRSGTNMLHGLLCEHDQFMPASVVAEDFLLANAELLTAFVDGVEDSWGMLYNGAPEGVADELLRSTWHGIEQTLRRWTQDPSTAPEQAWRVARTPSVENLDLLGRLTDSKAVVIVRDGRGVLESGMRSFGWPFEEYLQRWVESAEIIRDVARDNPQIHVVRYEDLLSDKRSQLGGVFSFFGVSDADYPYETDIPVFGSSEQIDRGQYWEGHAAPEGFDPLNRWHHWDPNRRSRFAELAGPMMEEFGYDMEGFSTERRRGYNLVMDVAWPARKVARSTARAVLPRNVRGAILWKRGEKYRDSVRSESS